MNRKDRRTKSSGGSSATGVNSDPLAALFNDGLQHQSAGRLADAEKIYRHILNLNPRHANTLHMMGLIAFEVTQYATAEQLMRKSLEERSDVPVFYSNLGNTLKAQGKNEDAIQNYLKAIKLKPDFADCLNNLASTLLIIDKKDEALKYYKQAVAANPQHFNAINNIGVILQQQKKYQEATQYYKQAITIKPDFSFAHRSLGLTLKLLNNIEEAKTCFLNAIQYQPDYADAISDLANLLRDQGKYDEALAHYQHLTILRKDGHAHGNIGALLNTGGRHPEALNHYKLALELLPNSFEIYNNIGTLQNEMGLYKDSVENYKKSLSIQPGNAEVLSNVGTALKNLGQLGEAIVYFKQAVAAAPHNAYIYSNLLLTMIYAESVSPELLADTAREFGTRLADPLAQQTAFMNDKNPDRKLRIGYVSPDFFQHAVNFFFEPLLDLHDRKKFEIFAYSNTVREDDVTQRLKTKVDHWRDIRFLNDGVVAGQIESDKIDILIDLAGHTAKNRLLVFARKPAPIQVSWLGYPATSGMKAMDYRITDIYAEPPGMTEHLNVETLWRLPEIFCCYKAHEDSPAVIDHPPFEHNGYVTFGCFNNFTKVTDSVLRTWIRILDAAPNSRLLLEIAGIHEPTYLSEVTERLKNLGLPMERVILEPRKKENQFVLYNRIDIALDPFPCVGGTTSMDTVWMGVPFVTLAGKHFVSRMGVTILTNAGLSELIAENLEEYISKASDLANDRERLKKMRHNLRDKVAASPIMNQEAFARNMEYAYREMWCLWCKKDG